MMICDCSLLLLGVTTRLGISKMSLNDTECASWTVFPVVEFSPSPGQFAVVGQSIDGVVGGTFHTGRGSSMNSSIGMIPESNGTMPLVRKPAEAFSRFAAFVWASLNSSPKWSV